MSLHEVLRPFGVHPMPMLVVDPADGAIVDVNPAACRFYGWSREIFVTKRIGDINLLIPDELSAALGRVASGDVSRLHFRHRLASGDVRHVEVHSGPIEVDGRTLLFSVVIDESARIVAEQSLARRDRLYALLSETNQRLIRARDRETLFADICQLAIEHGDFRFSWIGLVDDRGRIVPVARAGDDHGYIDAIEATVVAGDARSAGPIGRAAVTGAPVIANDFAADPSTLPWREHAALANVGAAAAFPLREEGRVIGVLTLYAEDTGFFGEAEVSTLTEMAADVSYGLDMLVNLQQRRAAELEVAAWNERLAQYLESSPSISYALAVTPTGPTLEWVSPNAERILGYVSADLEVDGWWTAHLHPDDRDAAVRAMAAITSTGVARVEYRLRTADGRDLRVLDTARFTPSPTGGRISGTWTDVTDRHAALEALRDSEERLRLALASTRQGLYDFDITTGTAHVTDEYATMLGYDPATFRESLAEWRERTHPDDRARVTAVLDAYLAGERSEYRVELRQRARDGAWRWVLSVGRIVERDAAGRPLRMLGTHTDITELKQAEGALHLRGSALEAAADAIVITDRTGRIEWANPAFTALTGYSLTEAEGHNPREFLRSGVQSPEFYAEMWRTILSGAVWRGELINRRKDGTQYPESLTITPVRDEQGVIQHFIAIKRDLTEDRSLREHLLQAQKMESVGRLAGGVAHDFNNLLTVINGSIELALGGVPEEAPLRHDLLEIRHAADRAVALTRQLLAFSRRQILRRHLVDVPQLIDDLSRLLRRLIGEDITLVTELPGSSARVLADPSQLEQVVMNLVVNARDAMPHGGTLTLRTTEVVLDARAAAAHGELEPGRYLQLSVQDTGVGMSPEIAKRIFEPFFTTKGAGQGTGLGLSTVYGIVRQTGGVVTVDSALGAGSVFHILLPIADEAADAARTPGAGVPAIPGASETAGSRGTVLVVDDEPVLRKIAMRILSRSGYTVLEAGNAEEAIALFEARGGGIDLLLTDVVMPGMSGPQLATALTARYPALKVLFASGYTDDMVLRHGVDGATMEFLGKPYTLQDLVGRVGEMLQS